MQLKMQETRKNVLNALLKKLKKNKSIKWNKIIMSQSGRDTLRTRNAEKVLKSNQQISRSTASNNAADRNIVKNDCASMKSHINYEMPLGSHEFKSNLATKSTNRFTCCCIYIVLMFTESNECSSESDKLPCSTQAQTCTLKGKSKYLYRDRAVYRLPIKKCQLY